MLPKYLIVFVGLPGTGKSTLAYKLGKELNFVVIDKENLKSCLLLSNISENISAPLSYHLVWEIAKDLLIKQKQSLIIDSVAGVKKDIQIAQKICELSNSMLRIIACDTTDAVRQTRIQSRESLISQPNELDFSNPRHFKREIYLDDLPKTSLILETDNNYEDLVHLSMNYILSKD